MDAREAELIYLAGKEAVIKVLLEMAARIKALEQQVLVLEKRSLPFPAIPPTLPSRPHPMVQG